MKRNKVPKMVAFLAVAFLAGLIAVQPRSEEAQRPYATERPARLPLQLAHASVITSGGRVDDHIGLDLGAGESPLGRFPVWRERWDEWSDHYKCAAAIGDLDADGDIDLVQGGARIEIHLNESPVPTLKRVVSFPVPVDRNWMFARVKSIALGDVDGNATLDLVYACSVNSSQTLYHEAYVCWLRNDGDGRMFENNEVWRSDSLVEPTAVALGDVDNDGDLDLVCGNEPDTQQVSIYLNVGGPEIFAGPVDCVLEESEATNEIAVADMNGDGELDLVCNTSKGARLYLNVPGNSLFEPTPRWRSLEVSVGGLAAGDVDGKGQMDLILSDTAARELAFYRNIGPPTVLDTAPKRGFEPVGAAPSGLVLGDYDLDGDLDVACCVEGDSNAVYRNDRGALTPRPAWRSSGITTTRSAAWIDYDGDRDLDVLFVNFSHRSEIYRNDGIAISATLDTIVAAADRPSRIDWGDYDGDGDIDLASTHKVTKPATVYENNNCGLAFAAVPTPEPGFTQDLEWGDYDNDHDLDLICGNSDGPDVLYRNDSKMLDSVWTSKLSDATASVAWGDYDGDGDLDLARVSCLNNSTIFSRTVLYRNDGGALTRSPVWQSSQLPSKPLAWGDYDHDGDFDLSNPYAVFENRLGVLDTIPAELPSRHDGAASTGWGDFDADGDLDLACGSAVSPTRIYRNDEGVLGTVPIWTTTLPVFETELVSWIDIDHDGDLDLVCGNKGSSDTLYKNDNGSISVEPTWLPDLEVSAQWADIDCDGDSDFLLKNDFGLAVRKATANDISELLPNNPAFITNAKAETLPQPNHLEVSFSLRDKESDHCRIIPEYATYGGGKWHPCVLVSPYDRTERLATSPDGVRHSLIWDTTTLVGEPKDVVLRIRVLSNPDRAGVSQRFYTHEIRFRDFRVRRPSVRIAPTRLDFKKTIAVGDQWFCPLSIRNHGSDPLLITGVTNTSEAFALTPAFEDSVARSLTLPPNTTITTHVLFVPERGGSYSGYLYIHSNDPRDSVSTIEMRATSQGLDFSLFAPPADSILDVTKTLDVTLTMKENVDTESAHLHVRRGGDTNFAKFNMSRFSTIDGDKYFASVPSMVSDARGVEFYAVVFNGARSESSDVYRMRSKARQVQFPTVQPARRYRLISIPFEYSPGSMRSTLTSLGDWGRGTRWRLFTWQPETARYLELRPDGGPSEFKQGRGYWLITNTARELDTGEAEGTSAHTDSAFVIRLQPQKWNLIGNPFNFPVAWDMVRVDFLSMADALAPEHAYIDSIWWWDPMEGDEGDYREVTAGGLLRPFESYWVYDNKATVLRIPPIEATVDGVGEPADSIGIGGLTEEGPDDEWNIQVEAFCSGARDTRNFLGVKKGASVVWDPYDQRDPPLSPGGGVTVYFPHGDWEQKTGHYAADLRGEYVDVQAQARGYLTSDGDFWGHVWNFDVARASTDSRGVDEVKLVFRNVEQLPECAIALFVDKELRIITNLKDKWEYSFLLGEKDYVQNAADCRFTLLIGSETFVSSRRGQLPGLPETTELLPNFPNPFNPSTAIRYDIAKAGAVTIRIYNVRGERVRELYNGYRPQGRYEVAWDGRNDQGFPVSSGMYFCRLENGEKVITRKLLLVK